MGFDLLCSPSSPLSFLSLLLQRPIIESPSPFYPKGHFNNFFGCLTIANKRSYKKASPVSNWNHDGNWALRKALPILVLEFLIFKMPEWNCDSPLWDSPRAHREPTLCTWERNVSIWASGLINGSANPVLLEKWNSRKTRGDVNVAKHSPVLF